MTDPILFFDNVLGAPEAVETVTDFFAALYENYLENNYVPDPESQSIIIATHDYTVELTQDGWAYGPYDELHDYLKETGLSSGAPGSEFVAQAHHLLQVSFVLQFGLPGGDVPAVALDRFDEDHHENTHQLFTDEIREELGQQTFQDIGDLFDAHAKVYDESGHPEWTDRVLDYITDHRDELIARYESGDVPGADRPDYDDRAQQSIAWLRAL